MYKCKWILLFILIYLVLGGECYAQSQFSPTLSRIEKSLFGLDYNSQSDDIRLKRIEEVVYGAPSSSSVPQRVGKLSKDLSADLIGKEIKPKRDTFADDEDGPAEVAPKSDNTVDYPIVDNLEQKVFKKEFKDLDINQRLSKLEQTVFKKTYSDDLSNRVDRLRTAVMPERIAKSDDDDDSQNIYRPKDILDQDSLNQQDSKQRGFSNPFARGGANQGYNSLMPDPNNPFDEDSQMSYENLQRPSYNAKNSVLDDYQSNYDLNVPLASLEKSVLKKSYPNDTVSNRLTRLELKMFNSTFFDDDEQTRFDRVASAYQAKKTAKKYDSNKTSQRMSTAVQVGAILLMILAAIL